MPSLRRDVPRPDVGLILQGAFARIMQAPDQPFDYTPEQAAALVAAAADRWGTGDTGAKGSDCPDGA